VAAGERQPGMSVQQRHGPKGSGPPGDRHARAVLRGDAADRGARRPIVKEEGRVGCPARGRERGCNDPTGRRRVAPGAASVGQREKRLTNVTTDLVTGRAGLIGSHVTAELLRRGRAVRVGGSFSTDVMGLGVSLKRLAELQYQRGSLADAQGNGREALACHQEAEDRLGQANDFQILGLVMAAAGELAAAAECASRAQEMHRPGGISRRLGDKRGRLRARARILRARLEAPLCDARAQERRELLAKPERQDS